MLPKISKAVRQFVKLYVPTGDDHPAWVTKATTLSLLVVVIAWYTSILKWTIIKLLLFIPVMLAVTAGLSYSATCMRDGGCHSYASFILLSSYLLFSLVLIHI